ncbi:MAG: hypothetical protein J1E62_09415 [Lachnospiraceae bacterium]|nr:hypothetical protein [Lachnospiraceae bacterium]
MIFWNDRLYADDKVSRHLARYQKRVERKGFPKGFCVVLGDNPENSLEVYSSRTPWFRYQREQGVHIVGLATNYDRALKLVQQIVSDVYRENGMVDSEKIREYFA